MAQSQFVVGYVSDEVLGDPIYWVDITTVSGKYLGKTDLDGSFEVEVFSNKLLLKFSKTGYEDFVLNLVDLEEFVDVEVTLISKVNQLSNLNIFGIGSQIRQDLGKQSIEQLEKFQGLRIDLNDHLRQLSGVSGIGEYSNDLSIYGGRTLDVVSYLGGTRIPHLRHLNFGIPGNQSVLNPRLLQSISVEDNLSRGPIDQGNSSALLYQLKQKQFKKITGDIVFGTFNREINISTFFDKRTFIASFRLIQPTFLINIARNFFTIPKETRLDRNCNPNVNDCSNLNENPLEITVWDGLFSTSYFEEETGEFSRWTFLLVSDDFEVLEDVSNNFDQIRFQTIEQGSQFKGLLSYENTIPFQKGTFFYSLGILLGTDINENRDTSLTSNTNEFYLKSANSTSENMMGDNKKESKYVFGSLQWTPDNEWIGGGVSYHTSFEYRSNKESLRDFLPEDKKEINASLLKMNAIFRWHSLFNSEHSFSFSIGTTQGTFNFLLNPLGNIHYHYQVFSFLGLYTDIAYRRQNSLERYLYQKQTLEDPNSLPVEVFSLTEIKNKTTTSGEVKLGLEGEIYDLDFSLVNYFRYYQNPTVPKPNVYWNFKELSVASSSQVLGFNFNLIWSLSSYFGFSSNLSVVKGQYHLEDGSSLQWEANRSLDWVLNLKLNPRGDSLFSIIISYVVNNDVPLYQYELFRKQILQTNSSTQFRSIDVGTRRVQDYKTVSRQRVDIRAHLDLTSRYKPLNKLRFYFQATNIFSNFNQEFFQLLGGKNQKQRGWTRLAQGQGGSLTPVLIQGLGLFILFGFEFNFSI